ncbi:histidine kinase [Micromonospora sp. NBC_00362]|uniref:sensor histidine kinase n=1 Tax=Micromonospora sp. NBC_00362 TaxID=2975975 RepID=UPI0022570ACC|nr:histidine kinase [Micromonospora sp. NBC_00362]MCX5122103.1 histidine kinase [Micromonospora sp. NBC_00362]
MFRTPPASVSYFLAWIHAILGAALWLPTAVGGVVAGALAPTPARPGVFVATTVLLVLVSGLFGISRAAAIRLGNALLHAEIPPTSTAHGWTTRLRSAGWTLLHAGSGAALLTVMFQALFPAAALPILWIRGGGSDATFYGMSPSIDGGWSGSWTLFVSLGLVTLVVAAGVGYAGLLRWAAPRLLGPSAAERMAAVQRHADQLAHRNRLARELHDSIGHTLTATTIQAAVASTLIDSDPQRARHTMGSIEQASRTALEDLDHVLGVLREDTEGTPSRQPQHTLTDLDALLQRVRDAGTLLDAVVTGDPDQVPAPVSREAYRIVQEGLTNAMRHPGPVTVRISVGQRRLDIELTNPMPTDQPVDAADRRGGRGLAGIAERVHVLRGEVTAGPVTDHTGQSWRLVAWLPLRSTP